MYTHKYADLNGVRLHYVTAGEGLLLLFLHGFPDFWYMWRDQFAQFSDAYQVVAPDMRGYNLSSKPKDVHLYTMPYLVEDVRALVAHLEYDHFTLVGHDWGGVIAWAFTESYPDLLDRLIIINASPMQFKMRELRHSPEQQQAARYMLFLNSPEYEQFLTGNNYERLRYTVFEYGIPEGYFTEADHQMYMAAWTQPGALLGGVNYYRAASLTPAIEQDAPVHDYTMRMISVPTLVIWGDQDWSSPLSNLDGLDQFVTNLTIKHIPDGMHRVMHEKAELVNRYLREFLEQQASRQTSHEQE